MANKATRSHTIKFAHKAQDAVGYELVSTTSNVHISADGKLSPAGITYVAHRVTGSKREVLTCDTAASEFAVWAVFTGRDRQQVASNKNLSAKLATDYYPCHLDLVRRDAGENYAQSDILATIPISMQRDGQDGSQGAFTSIAFTRSTKNLNSAEFTPQGGTYSDPNPTTPGWSDAPPEGTDPLWMSRAKFTPDMTDENEDPRPQWSKPSPVADSTDMEIIWSAKENPAAPTKQHPYPDSLGDWGKEPSGAVWMAVALKNNGAWGDWKLMKIKGENGKDGTDGKDAVMAVLTPGNLVFKAGDMAQKSVTVTMRVGSSTAIPSDVTATGLPAGLTMTAARDTTAKTVTLTFSYDGTAEFDTSLSLIAQYLRQGYKLTLGVSTVSDGSDGKPGADGKPGEDAVSVNVGMNGIVFKRGSLPEYVDVPITAFKGSTPLMPYSGFMVVPSDPTGFADELKAMGFSDYTVWNNGAVLYLRLNVDAGATSPEGKVNFNVLIVEGKVACPQEISVMTVADGGKGDSGPYIPPPMLWEDYPDNYGFKQGKEGEDRLDVVYRKFTGSTGIVTVNAYRCTKSHTKTTTPPEDDKTNWGVQATEMNLLATDVLLAQNAFIKLMSSNGISIFDGQNLCGQIIGSGQAESRRLVWMGGTAKNPKWAVNNEGVHFFGGTQGQRIELDPVSKDMRFYDEAGELTATHSGRSIALADAIPGGVASGSDNIAAFAPGDMKGGNGKTVTVSKVSGKVSVKGVVKVHLPQITLKASAGSNVTMPTPGFGSGTATIYGNGTGTLYVTVECGGKKKSIHLGSVTYSNDVIDLGGNVNKPLTIAKQDLSFPEVPVAKGATYTVSLELHVGGNNDNAAADATFASTVNATLLTEFYNAHYGANGFVLSTNSENYVYFLFDGGVLHAKCVAGGKTVFEG